MVSAKCYLHDLLYFIIDVSMKYRIEVHVGFEVLHCINCWQLKEKFVGEIMLLENSEPQKVLGSVSVVPFDFERDRIRKPEEDKSKLVHLFLKTVVRLDAPLPFVEVDGDGKGECNTLDEAFMKHCAIWWSAPSRHACF